MIKIMKYVATTEAHQIYKTPEVTKRQHQLAAGWLMCAIEATQQRYQVLSECGRKDADELVAPYWAVLEYFKDKIDSGNPDTITFLADLEERTPHDIRPVLIRNPDGMVEYSFPPNLLWLHLNQLKSLADVVINAQNQASATARKR